MTCGNLSKDDNITHYVKPSKVQDDGSIDPSVFRESALHDDGISVNWLEFFGEEREDERLRRVALSIQRETSFDGRFAEMNVGDVIDCLGARGCQGNVLHDPQEAQNGYGPDPSHCLIQGLPVPGSKDNKLAAEAIADCVRAEHVPPVLQRRPGTRTKSDAT